MPPSGYNTNPGTSLNMPVISFSDANTAVPSMHGLNNHVPSSSHLETLDLPLGSYKGGAVQISGIPNQIAATSASTLSSNPNRQKFSDLGISLINDK